MKNEDYVACSNSVPIDSIPFQINESYAILRQTQRNENQSFKKKSHASCTVARSSTSNPKFLIYELFGDTCKNLNSRKHPRSNYKLFFILLKVDHCKSLEVATFSQPISSTLFQNLHQRSIYIPSSSQILNLCQESRERRLEQVRVNSFAEDVRRHGSMNHSCTVRFSKFRVPACRE